MPGIPDPRSVGVPPGKVYLIYRGRDGGLLLYGDRTRLAKRLDDPIEPFLDFIATYQVIEEGKTLAQLRADLKKLCPGAERRLRRAQKGSTRTEEAWYLDNWDESFALWVSTRTGKITRLTDVIDPVAYQLTLRQREKEVQKQERRGLGGVGIRGGEGRPPRP